VLRVDKSQRGFAGSGGNDQTINAFVSAARAFLSRPHADQHIAAADKTVGNFVFEPPTQSRT
jgi:hypothetical protein